MEVATLKPDHIDGKNMLIKVEQAKGGKERYTVLSSRLLKELRQYYKTCKPPTLPLPLKVTRDVLLWFEPTARPATIAILRW